MLRLAYRMKIVRLKGAFLVTHMGWVSETT